MEKTETRHKPIPQIKKDLVKELQDMLKDNAGVFVADYRGLTVEQVNGLRKAFRNVGAEYRVVKNTLMRRAIAGTSLDALKDHLKGTTAIAVAKDAVGTAKAALDFAKINEAFKLRSAFVEGQLLAAEGIKALSTMPTREEIRSQLLGLINSPAAKLLAQINAAGQQLAGVLQAHVDKQNEGQKAA